MSHTPHAIIVGAGFGGMAAAIRMRARGFKVTLLEANEQLGGRASVFERDGYTFDAGPTVITAPYLFDELFELSGRKAEDYFQLVPVDPFYRVKYDDGSVFDYVGEEERILEQIRQLEPRDVDGYLKFADHARRIFDVGYTELVDQPFSKPMDMLRVAPKMVKLENYRSVFSLAKKYMRDERLRQAFTFQPLLIGGNPFNSSSIYMLIHWLERKWGVWYAMGGTGAIVRALGTLMDEMGIDVHLSTPVESVDIKAGKVRALYDSHGKRWDCDLAVMNADPSWVYTRMIDRQDRRRKPDWLIKSKKQSMSLFVAYFGTKKQYPETAHHTILLGPRYKELLDEIFHKKTLADDFSLYLHAPTRSDPSMAPEGHECFYVLSPVPNQRSGIDWEETHEAYLQRILDHLDATELPGLKDNLDTCFAVDPRYFEHRLRSYDGAAFGLEPRLSQSAYFRYHNKDSEIDGLYFVGASTHPGAGVPGVLNTAKTLENVLPEVAESDKLPLPSRGKAVKVA